MKQLILASASPARKELLERIGVPFMVDVSDYEEDMMHAMPPHELAKHLAAGKAKDVARRHKNAVILAADSFAEYNGQLLGKPHTEDKAKEMLTMLSGTCHSFITGFAILDADTQKQFSDVCETTVCFRGLTAQEIDSYIKKEQVLNNAGAYRIQDLGSVFVEKIDGSFSNVMGLPIAQVSVALRSFGVHFI